jgi:glucose/arabinose dehydrogenase
MDLEQVATGLQAPVFATHAGDGSGRLFVVEKPGTILAPGQPSQPFLDIRDRVGSRGFEQGLLGLAFHPQFAANGLLFVYYTGTNGDTVISRFQANADRTTADPTTEAVLLTQAQPAANHNGGMLAFGPDGMLYAGLGDGGAAGDPWGNGQSLSTLLGKIIRLDVDGGDPYAVLADNPFVGRDGVRGEIWAYGLRNPWRFAFDRASGDLYIADVGQNQWEEVNVQPATSPGGENYGWDIMEASTCFSSGTCDQSSLVLPVAEYDHSQGCSVTGGHVYRGTAQPSLQGAYFYGDYCSGRIWALSQDANGQWRSDLLLDTNLQISSFGETEEGEVLVVDYGGTVYRLVDR